MPKIFYKSSDYKNNYARINTNGEASLNCRKVDLYRSIITVGNPSFISKQMIKDYGLARTIYSSVIEKVGVVFENIMSDKNGMRLHPIYHRHVSDKKRIVSYNLGMAFAKFYAEKLLDVPSLVHVESLKALGAIEFVEGEEVKEREPDLVGQCLNGNWHVFEAKGMSINQLSAKIRSAKEQVQRVSSINGIPPQTLNACATYFNDNRIITYLVDPESKKEKDYKIKRGKFLDAIYEPIFLFEKALDRKLKIRVEDGFRYYALNLEAKGLKLTVGIEEEIYDLIQHRNISQLPPSLTSKFINERLREREQNFSLGLDGIVVKYRDY